MATDAARVVGYVRVSTEQQGESGAGLDAQEDAITRETERRGWTLVEMFCDVASGKSLHRRPNLEAAVQSIQDGNAGTLMVSKLDRLSRSVVDFGGLMERANRGEWNIVVIDLGVDLSTPAGEMVGSIMASLAQWERRMISQRTRDALASRQRAGMKLGRPIRLDPDTEGMICTLAKTGASLRGIATELNRAGVPTSQGGTTWRASSVKAILSRIAT